MTEANYRDPTHISKDSGIDQNKVSEFDKAIAKYLREKMYGKDVREALARAVEHMSTNEDFEARIKALEQPKIGGTTE